MSLPLQLGGPGHHTFSGARSLNMADLNLTSVDYQGKVFTSASDALQAYIENFEGKSPVVKYDRQVNELLSTRTVLSQTVDRSLDTGIRHTREEKRLYDMKRMVDESFEKIVKEEEKIRRVKEVLSQSAKVLHEVSTDRHSSDSVSSEVDTTNIPSDLDSLSTDMLVSIPPLSSRKSRTHKTQKKHVYSYKTNYQGREDPGKLTMQELSSHTEKQTKNNQYYKGGLSNGHTKTQNSLSLSIYDKSRTAYPKSFEEQYYEHRHAALPEKDQVHVFMAAGQENLGKHQRQLSLPPGSNYSRIKGGGRPPPSWITEVPENIHFPVHRGKSSSPRYFDKADDMNSPPPGGRPPPSWITEVPENRHFLGHLDKADNMNSPPLGGRSPPSWITEVPDFIENREHRTRGSLVTKNVSKRYPGLRKSHLDSPPDFILPDSSSQFRPSDFRAGGAPPPGQKKEAPEHPYSSDILSTTAKRFDDDDDDWGERSPPMGGRAPPSWITNVTDTQTVPESKNKKARSVNGTYIKQGRKETRQDIHSFSDIEEEDRVSQEGRPPPSWITNVPGQEMHTDAARSSNKIRVEHKPVQTSRKAQNWISSVSEVSGAPVSRATGRPAPSWITDVPEMEQIQQSYTKHPTPSWITDVPDTDQALEANARHPTPSWITDVPDTDQVLETNARHPTPSWITDVPDTDQVLESNARHPTPSWITDVQTVLEDFPPNSCVKPTSSWLTDSTSDVTSNTVRQGNDLMSSSGTVKFSNIEDKVTRSTQDNLHSSTRQGAHTAEVSMKGKAPPSWIGELEHPGVNSRATVDKAKEMEDHNGRRQIYKQDAGDVRDYDFPSEKYLTDWSKYTRTSSLSDAAASSTTLPATQSSSSATYEAPGYTFGRHWAAKQPNSQHQAFKRRYPSHTSSDRDGIDHKLHVPPQPERLDVLERQITTRSQSSSSSGRKEYSPRRWSQQENYESSPQTDVVLEGDRSWERIPAPFKTPRYVEENMEENSEQKLVWQGRMMDKFLQDCLSDTQGSTSPRLTGQNTPGSMEALKTILFKMQGMATAAADDDDDEEDEESSDKENATYNNTRNSKGQGSPVKIRDVTSVKLNMEVTREPGAKSLERALLHLSRLQSIVQMSDDLPSSTLTERPLKSDDANQTTTKSAEDVP